LDSDQYPTRKNTITNGKNTAKANELNGARNTGLENYSGITLVLYTNVTREKVLK
jgi:hypothetical protein